MARIVPIIRLIAIALLMGYSAATFAQTCEVQVHTYSIQGEAEVMRSGENDWEPVELNDFFCPLDQVRTLDFSRVGLQFEDETVIRLEQNTSIIIPELENQDESWLDILTGAVHIILRTFEGNINPRPLNITTPFANAGIEGTEFLVEVTSTQSTITVFEGMVAMSNAIGAIQIASGQSASASAGIAPSALVVVRPRDAVQWTLYYPTIIGSTVAANEQAGNLRANDASFFVERAARRLQSGNVEQASTDLTSALQIDSNNSDALALQSIINVTQNSKEIALELADRAVSISPNSDTALLAQSYARQSLFDNEGARSSLQSAVSQNPNNALVLARLSELNLALGDLDGALTSAQQATALDPTVALSQTILGFAYLAQIDTAAASASFLRAIELDSSSPLSRLGLGLAQIRNGDLENGREEIALAVMLDPSNSLVRSYIGKAYYEELRSSLAAVQLDIAKTLDPLDPTPWFYDAIRAQTENQPVAALQNLQKSIELNDNRAVYRSRFLLDGDLAARSASLGRIYRDLGFERLALLEGWKSQQSNSSNFSGHRLLADVYSSEPRHQIARVNELFQSQLLQPENIAPIQPQLSEPNIFILDSAGPTDLALNEFNPLFSADGFTGQISATRANNNTTGHDVVLSGIQGKWSFSVGQFEFETDGFRENNDLEQEISNGFIQYRISNKTKLQAEVRSTNTEKGDLQLLFNSNDFIPILRAVENTDSARIGISHSFSNSSTLLGSIIYQEAEISTDIPPTTSFFDKFYSYQVEVQHQFQGESWQLTSGLRKSENDEYSESSFLLTLPTPPFTIETNQIENRIIEFRKGYLYANAAWKDLVFTIGGSYDSLDGAQVEKDVFNPKFGLVWTPNGVTTFRLAAFRNLQGPVISKFNILPNLEPTQIAGFNQIYFGAEGEESFRYGIAADHQITNNFYAGIEYSERELKTPFLDFSSMAPINVTVDTNEELVRAYAYWTTSSNISISSELQYEKFDNHGRVFSEVFEQLEMYRVPLELNFFHAAIGLSYSISGTYVHQQGFFPDTSIPPFLPPSLIAQEDSFWVFDGEVKYSFPNRNGILSLRANNLSNEKFFFQDTDSENPRIFPERFVSLNLTFRF